jgi:tetratricopeptide (TPR) repeat protein
MAGRIDALLALLDRGQDSALLRFSLGSEYAGIDDLDRAIGHLQQAVAMDPHYSAAWKALGRTLAAAGRAAEARSAFRTGIGVAEKKGDRQAAKEMSVFLRRLEKKRPD